MAKNETAQITQDKAIRGVLAMLVAEREDRLAAEDADQRKTEAVLATAGLTANEIAPFVGKSTEAVAKAIQRARLPKKKTSTRKKS
jgi:DNA-directed RNA polymerase specialized sigma24 family protein